MTLSNNDLRRFIKKELSPARYRHCIAVGEFAARLSRKHGWNPYEAERVGILHDIAKEWSPLKLIQYVKRHGIRVPDVGFIVKNSPNMLHAYAGAHFVKKKKWLTNSKSIKAIRSHTLGAVPMNLEDKIIYVADLASPDRVFKKAPLIRKIALEDIHEGFVAALNLKIEYQLKKQKFIHPYAVHVWNKIVCQR